MYKRDLIKYFQNGDDSPRNGAVSKIAELLNIDQAAVSQWGEIIPREKALLITVLFQDKDIIRKFADYKGEPPVYDASFYEHVWDNSKCEQ